MASKVINSFKGSSDPLFVTVTNVVDTEDLNDIGSLCIEVKYNKSVSFPIYLTSKAKSQLKETLSDEFLGVGEKLILNRYIISNLITPTYKTGKQLLIVSQIELE